MRFEPEEGQEFFRNDLSGLFPLIRYNKNRSTIYIFYGLLIDYKNTKKGPCHGTK